MKTMKKVLLPLILLSLIILFSGCGSTNSPYIGENGNWWLDGTDLGIPSKGEDGKPGANGEDGKPGENGQSITVVSVEKTSSVGLVDTYTITFSDNSTTTFTVTNGEDGVDGKPGANGEDGKPGADGEDGKPGENGQSITVVSVEKTSSVGLVDTYTITFSDNTTTTFTVTNGEDGVDGKPGADGEDGKPGENGQSITVVSVEKTSSVGLVDTYTITFSDNTTTTFTVTNGQDGINGIDGEDGTIIEVGINGNWFIDGVDSGIHATYNYETRKITNGLVFTPMTYDGAIGMVLTSIDTSIAWTSEQMAAKTCELIIPDYVGSVPVVGIKCDSLANTTYLKKVSLSKNTEFIASNTFSGCTYLEEVDFNNCKMTEIKERTFYDTAIKNITLPESVTKLGNYALYSNYYIESINYQNIKYFGDYSLRFNDFDFVYLNKNVEYIGQYAFGQPYIYIEHEQYPDNWSTNNKSEYNLLPAVNCKINDEYIYSINDGNVTIYQTFKDDEVIEIASTIDGYPVTTIGAGFIGNRTNVKEIVNRTFDFETREYKLPNTITSIENFAVFIGALVHIPQSVERLVINSLEYSDFVFEFSFYTFEGSTYPTIYDTDYNGNETEVDITTLLNENYFRNALNVEYSKLVYEPSTKSYLYEDSQGYQLLCNLNYEDNKSITIPSSFNDKTIHTIKPKAFYKANANVLNLENGITKIQRNAFIDCDFDYIYIPSSVEIINAHAFDNAATYIYTSHISLPYEWDSLWTNCSNIVYNAPGEIKVSEDEQYIYFINRNNTITLLKYIGIYKDIISVPRDINGYIVTKICSRCYSFYDKTYYNIYIPNTVTEIEADALHKTYTQYYTYAYIETSEVPSGWNSTWTTNVVYTYNMGIEAKTSQDGLYVYSSYEDGTVSLIEYKDTISGSIRIPRTVDGLVVTRVCSKCYQYTIRGSLNVYIPENVVTMDNQAIAKSSSSYSTYIYFEASNRPSGFDSGYVGGYKIEYFDSSLDY